MKVIGKIIKGLLVVAFLMIVCVSGIFIYKGYNMYKNAVKGIVYDRSDEFGVFVAVDHQFSARIPKKDVFGKIRIGDEIEARVTNVKEDGKLDLSVRGKIPQQMDADAELILKRIQSYDGVLPFNDKADPDTIKAEFGMSKAAFKRAVGRLLKENRVKIFPDSIRIR